MASLPGVTIVFSDNASGLGSGSADGIQLKVGVCSAGTVNTVQSFTQPSAVRAALGVGPLVESAAHHLGTGASSVVLCLRLTASVAGTLGAVTAAGATPPTLTPTGAPNDAYQFKVIITLAGALNAGKFRLSRDGGDNYDPEQTLQASVVDAASGVTLGFAAGSYNTGHSYTFEAVAPSYSTGDLTTALAAAKISGYDFDTVHVVGVGSTSANDATKATTLNGVLEGWKPSGLYVAGIIEAGGTDAGADDATVISAFASVNAPNVAVFANYCELVEDDGDQLKRPAGMPGAAHCARVARFANGIATQPMQVVGGALPSIVNLNRDEFKNPGLNDARLATLRTYSKEPGFYITNVPTLASPASDLADWPNLMVINKAQKFALKALFPFTGKPLKVNANGTLQEDEATRIEARVQAQLKAVLVDSKNAEDVLVAVDRTNNVKLTSTVKVSIRVKAFGYAKFIEATVGFTPVV